MSTIPSIQQIVSQYLWGQETMPASDELVDSKWIRSLDETTSIYIDQYEYMTTGAGRYATVDIRTGEKTILDYLLKPLNKAKEALRER